MDFDRETNKAQDLTDAAISGVFEDCGDFVRRELQTEQGMIFCYFIDGLVSSKDISEFLLRPISQQALAGTLEERYCQALNGKLYNAVADRADDLNTVTQKLVNGNCVLLFEHVSAIAFEVKTGEKRSPSPPEVENTVKSAKDAFTETMRTNTSLLRRHLRTPELRLCQTTVGKRSLTAVTVVFIKGLTNPRLYESVQNRLKSIDIDGLLSPAAVEEYVTGSRKTAFPLLQYTERPDKMAEGLLEGRVGLLVDGLPLGYLLPVDLPYLMTSPEDRGMDYLSASLVRVLRYGALLVSLLLPALYVAMAMYHPEMIPTKLLKAIIESKESVPFPTAVEVLGLLFAFELLQEAGIHLPQAIGQAVSIIGGLVVGTAAVDAKLVSPAALIVAAAAGICGFALPGRDLSDAIRLWRLGLTVLAACLGLFGVTAGVLLLLIHLASLQSLGLPYLGTLGDLQGSILRSRLVTQKYRDAALHPEDLRKQR